MASATMSEFENNKIVKNSGTDAESEVPVTLDAFDALNGNANNLEDGEMLQELDSDPTKQQFSNNATDLGIPITLQNGPSDNVNAECEENVKDKRMPEDTRNIEHFTCEQVNSAEPEKSTVKSPVVSTPEDVTSENYDDDTDYIESAGDERVACIEEEYIQRISMLEQRHNELENVLERLTTAVECGLSQPKQPIEKAADGVEEDGADTDDTEGATAATEPEKSGMNFSRGLVLDLFVEFQHKIRNFAEDLNGVLNCSEAAIRHARVVQEWATSVQLMFEQLKEERQKIVEYIDERERNMLVIKEQFIAELDDQGKTLKQLVEDMMSHNELQKEGEEYCKTKDTSGKRTTVEKIVDLLLKRRLEEDRSIILNLNKQSKISEMKLFIIHQQSCIQQLQEQNKELRAIIEGLMGPDDVEEENPCDSDQSGTPASVTSQDQCLLRQTLGKQNSPSLSLVSDVLYCDRGEYLPGNSTDGDVATVQAYGIGRDCYEVSSGEDIVFDPLSVSYVRDQCQQAEETERQAHLTVPKEDIKGTVIDNLESPEKEKAQEETDDDSNKDFGGIKPDTEQCQETCEETPEESVEIRASERNAAGDGADVTTEKVVSPRKDEPATENKEEIA
ncbi:uncharacterized protein LOC132723736 isoform X2 [Ruditapes philippinarum]|uniref:uncharacterized protein LOC132723736 isoform X2 n=1 Tax=Ruditapes philippinarum TaxID=129788 RepID=UPI00295AA954|nr:uncharacterized protein LOC132723736 isoform X2 [Ruditapes philippinarum]